MTECRPDWSVFCGVAGEALLNSKVGFSQLKSHSEINLIVYRKRQIINGK